MIDKLYETAFMTRLNQNPYQTGFIVCHKQVCGRKNCHCYKDKKFRHLVFKLKYWLYNPEERIPQQKTIHIKKSEVVKIQKELAIRKGLMLLVKLGDEAIFNIAEKYPYLEKEELYIKAYLLYGNSHSAGKWLNYQN